MLVSMYRKAKIKAKTLSNVYDSKRSLEEVPDYNAIVRLEKQTQY